MKNISESVEDILATVEVLSDPELIAQIRQGEREIEAGEGISLEELEGQISSDIEEAHG
jgi:predicted transcriptional regulator